jgi:geranylgeranyl pyrophosphate synthase
MNFETMLKSYQLQVEAAIDRFLPSESQRPARLHQAMRYSMQIGGKRIRPVTLVAVSELFSHSRSPLPAAVAIECIHTYSLIHDDLPCVDNARLRRGKPTCHIQFDEPTALLAGDALLTYAFELLANSYSNEPQIAAALILELSLASGSRHLIGGQMEDIMGEHRILTPEELDFIHLNKTARLLSAAWVMGVIVGGGSQQDQKTALEIGNALGLTFQIVDDILDAVSNPETLGKDVGQDHHKHTYVKLHGIDAARTRAHDLSNWAMDRLDRWNIQSPFLKSMITHLENRIA